MITRAERAVNHAVLTLFSVLALLPIIGILLSALTPPAESSASFSWPRTLDLGNFALAWQQGHFSSYLVTSVLVTLATVLLSGVLSIMAGFAFATFEFPGRTVLFYLLLLGLMVPEEAFIVPLYFDLRGLGLTDTFWALVLPQAAQSLAFGVFWMRNAFRGLPRGIIEAAALDGASHWALLWRILVPTARPALLTMAMLVTMWTWNEFLLPLVMVSGEALRTAPLGLTFFQSQHNTQFSLLAAASVIVALPVVLLYCFLQRHFISGMLSGALKG